MNPDKFSELLALGTGAQLSYNEQETFIEAFLRQVERTPNATAVVDEFSSISYRELDRQSDALASELIKSGVKADEFVAIKLPRVKEFLVAVIGIWKAGAAYMPIDMTYPEQRIRYMLEDSGTKFTIDESWLEKFYDSTPTHSSSVNKAHPDGVAILMYTSGSTGRPKGVLSSHRAVNALCSWIPSVMKFDASSKVGQTLPNSFVGSCPFLYPPLVSGSEVHIVSDAVRTDMNALNKYIQKKRLGQIHLVSGLARTFLNTCHPKNLIIMAGGESVNGIDAKNNQLVLAYGMSETMQAISIFVTSNSGDVPQIGKPAPGVTLMLEDENGNPVPPGEIGEVCIASPQVSIGYWNKAEQTANVFVNRPWSKYKVFRSGDLARWNENGVLEFHGRKDNMVKVRGNRVELGDVDSALLKIEGVVTGASAMRIVNGESLLCGYYVSSKPISDSSLRTAMAKFLPPYMIPSIFIRMDELPKLPNGKLDRLSLPVPEISKSIETVAPETEFEKCVFPVVLREMELADLGVTTNLISLGMTSLRAIRLSAVLKKELNKNIPLSQMLAHPTIREWERISLSEDDRIPVEEIREYYPLTDSQMGLYVEWLQNKEGDQYNLPSVLKLRGGDGKKLLNCVKKAVQMYPILKMHLAEQGDSVVQMRRDKAEVTVQYEELDFEPNDDYFKSYVKPFNLLGEDLARFNVFASPKAAWLFFDVHHIIFDGGSANNLLKAIASLYEGDSAEAETVTLYDYALYKENWKTGEDYQEGSRYFETLLDEVESFKYPSFSNNDASGQLGILSLKLRRQAIRRFCQQADVTENSFFATILTQVFHRISREKNIQIALFSSGRSMAELSGSIGMFVQTLPLVSRWAEGTLSNILQSVHHQIVETLSHDKFPFSDLAKRFGIKPNVMYVYQGDLVEHNYFGNQPSEWHRIPVKSAISPLSIEIEPSEDEYLIKFEYDNGLYEQRDVSVLVHSVETLAKAMAKSPLDVSINTLPIVSPEERQSLVKLGSGPVVEYGRKETFMDMFLRHVSATPDVTAVVDYCSSLTYRDLDATANCLAAVLVAKGVKPGDFVAVKMPRIKEFMVAVLGIWKAGAAYVPIDPDYPEDRIRYMLEDSEAKIVITPDWLQTTLLDPLQKLSSCGKTENVMNLARPENPAYMIYTSGSTGKPKGVVVTHANLRAFMAWLPKELELKPGEAVAQHASFSFDASICDLYSSLASGATLHILSAELRKDLEGLAKYMENHRIVGSTLSTQLGMELLNASNLKMRYMVLGGEKLKPVRNTSVRIYNGYGPTEFTVWSSHHIVDQSKDTNDIPIGRPVPNTISLIADSCGNLLPRGVAGELCLAGAQLSNGYWHRPELTAKSFVQCNALGGALMYRTGDLAQWNENGELEYLGRIDSQVKLRGFRIEMGEIEAALSRFEGIRFTIAEVKTVNGIQHLCAYYVSENEIDESALKAQISKTLTEYMIPDVFMRLESLPLTPNGKVDRKKLPIPEIRSTNYSAPQNKKEQLIADIFRIALSLDEPVGREDGFYALGGDSIKAIRIVSRLKEKGLQLNVAQLLKLQTVAAIAGVADFETELTSTDELFDIIRIPVEESFSSSMEYESIKADFEEKGETLVCAYPLTSMQEGMLLSALSNPESSAYHLSVRFELNFVPNEQQLSYALGKLLSKREVLRTAIIHKNVVKPLQAIVEERKLPLSFETISTEQDVNAALLAYDRQEFNRPIDLQTDPLFRCVCLKTGEHSCQLLFVIHHIIVDGWCNSLWMKDFFCYLEESVSGKELEENFCEFYGKYQSHISSLLCRAKESSLEYWKNLLSGYETKAEIPAYDKVTDENRALENEQTITLSRECTSKLEKLCSKNGCTINNAVEAAWGIELQKFNRTDDVVFAKVVSGRDNSVEDVSDVVGLFINSVPVRIRSSEEDTLLDVIKKSSQQASSTNGKDWCNLSEIQQQSNLGSNLFQSILAFENYEKTDSTLFSKNSGLKAKLISNHETNISEIGIAAYINDGALTIRIKFDIQKYSENTIKSVLHIFRIILCNMANSPQDKIATLSLTDKESFRKLIDLGTGPVVEYDKKETFMDMFLRNVSATPDVTAVVDYCSSLTYRDLDATANCLAAVLVAKGVKPGDFVAVKMPRVKEFMVAVLGIWKAGAAYVPVDLEYPEERIRFILEDSEAKVVITPDWLQTTLSHWLESCGKSANAINLARPENPAYMIYTSGSTGKPKGVVVTHANLRAFMAWLPKELELKPGEAVAQHASFSFDASVCDLYSSLASGATLHILSTELRKDLDRLAKYLENHCIVGSTLSTQLGMELLNACDLKMRYIILGGEKLKPVKNTAVKIINGYGPTEFTVLSSTHIVDQSKDVDDIPIGRPVPNSVSLIMDSYGNLLPRGMVGELCLVGDHLSNGYWHRPELTAKSFVQCNALGGVTMYRTGDLARWNENGVLECLGRIDSQVKLRGFRIEMGEIEATLSKFEGIRSAVADIKTINGIQHLCAYYVSENEIDESALKSQISKTLTEYMIPDVFMRLESLPLTPNGKVDKKKLPVPEMKADEIIAPETERERQLFAIVSEELGTDQFGVTTNLLSMGLTSLRAIRLSMTIKKKLGLNINTGDILSAPKIRNWKDSVSDRINVLEPRKHYPLTDNLLGIYIDWEHHRNRLQYNIPHALKFEGVDAKKLVNAVKKAISNHPYLKNRIVQVNGDIMQERHDDAELSVLYRQLDQEPSAEFFQSRVRPFNLLEDELARFEVYSSATTTYLFYDIHHIIFDGGSVNILMSDIFKTLSGLPLEKESVNAFDYSLFYEEWKNSENFNQYETYFNALVRDTESFLYPQSKIEEAPPNSHAHQTISLPLGTIRKYCHGLGITENVFFATVLTQVFHRVSREENILITTISNGRSMEQLANTVGMFVQTLPLISREHTGKIKDILHNIQNQIFETIRRDKYPLTKLSEHNGIKPHVLYAYQGDVFDDNDTTIKYKNISLSLDIVKMPLSINVLPQGETYTILIEYDAGLYTNADMKLLGDAFRNFALSVASCSPEEDVADICMTDAREKEALIKMGSGPVVEYDRNETFLDAFLRNVSATPDATAVVDSHSRMTYSKLDAAANSLAEQLVAEGVKSGDFVAVKMPRVKEFMVAVLGIWKAGAAYVPIDLEYPEERIRYMLEDSGAKVVITPDWLKSCSKPACMPNLARPENPAYMIYTSGSTGKPKGVVVTHANLRAFTAFRGVLVDARPGDEIAHYTSFCFDASLDDIVTPLACGGCIHILDEDMRRNMDAMVNYFASNHIIGLTLPTQMGMTLLNSYKRLPLRYIMLGGEKLKPVKNTAVKIINGYGPTEFTVCSCYHEVNWEKDIDDIPIGRPVPNSVSLIVDSYGNLLPQGMAGELCLAGAQLSKGYWNRSELTAKSFVQSKSLDGSMMYRTGDLARWNENGELEYLGRIDSQVKLRGFRIEMGEIEAALTQFEGIRSAVADIKTINGIQHLCAYYVSENEIDEPALKAQISKTLTEYMIPDVFMRLESLPLTPNGKVDGKKLPIVTLGEDKFSEPENDTEAIICRIFGAILSLDKYSATQDFFKAGASSLTCIKAIAMLQKNNLDIVYGDIFKYKTPRDLAAYINKKEDGTQITSYDFSNYDYTAINDLLKSTPKEISSKTAHCPLGDVLLTGATGFLGIHVLRCLLENTDSKVVVLCRSKDQVSSKQRLSSTWIYYFEKSNQEFSHRIEFVDADITDKNIQDKLRGYHYDTMINCAAYVKHFVANDIMDKINVDGVRNLIECCRGNGAQFVHISTYSIGGVISSSSKEVIDEYHLYIGQRTSNDYVRTKFLAERYVLEAIAAGQIRGKVIRLGNLMGRENDGEFQVNIHSNAFVNLLRSYSLLGCMPSSTMEQSVELSPIDRVAEAIVLLSATPSNMPIFQPYTAYQTKISIIIQAMANLGIHVKTVSDKEFAEKVREVEKNNENAEDLQGIFHYQSHVQAGRNTVQPNNAWTTQVLHQLGFNWHPTDSNYLNKFIQVLMDTMFFEKE